MLQKFLITATLIVCLGFGIVTPEQDSKRVMSDDGGLYVVFELVPDSFSRIWEGKRQVNFPVSTSLGLTFSRRLMRLGCCRHPPPPTAPPSWCNCVSVALIGCPACV